MFQLLATIGAQLRQYEDFPGVIDDMARAEYVTGNGAGIALQLPPDQPTRLVSAQLLRPGMTLASRGPGDPAWTIVQSEQVGPAVIALQCHRADRPTVTAPVFVGAMSYVRVHSD